MDKQEMSLVLQDVRKAYRLLADYQQRIIEMLDFIKDEILEAEHYYHDLPSSISPQSIHKIYKEQDIGKKFLPMLNMHLLWHKTQSMPNGQEWQNSLKENDLVFDISISTNESETSSALHIYVYQCIKYTRKITWYSDVWAKKYDYPKFGSVGNFKDDLDTIEYQIYGERIDLTELCNEEMTRQAIEKFRKNASEKLGCVV